MFKMQHIIRTENLKHTFFLFFLFRDSIWYLINRLCLASSQCNNEILYILTEVHRATVHVTMSTLVLETIFGEAFKLS